MPRGMSVSGADSIERIYMFEFGSRLRSECKFDRLPHVALARFEVESGRGFVAAMDHAILASRIAHFSVLDAEFVPIRFLQQLAIRFVMTVGHEVAGAFPAADIASRDRPRAASQVAISGEKFEVSRRAENRKLRAPLDGLRELLARRVARE